MLIINSLHSSINRYSVFRKRYILHLQTTKLSDSDSRKQGNKNSCGSAVHVHIFECRADKSDKYLLESLARANGYFPKEYAERVEAHDRFTHRRNEEMNRRNMMKNGIIAGIVAAGLPITEVYNTPILRNPSEVNPLYTTNHNKRKK